MSDSITLLRHPLAVMAKTWQADGTVKGYGDGKYFHRTEASVDSLVELSELLEGIQDEPHTVLIRGQYVGQAIARERDGTEYKPGRVRRALDYFDDQPLHMVLIDVDRFEPFAYDPLTQPQLAIDEFIFTMLPEPFAGAGYHWQLSNSQGHPSKGRTLNAHLWFWMAAPLTSAQLKAHAQETGLQTDLTLFNPVQAHYTALPVFEEGVIDPLQELGAPRWGYVSGLLGDELVLQVSEQAMAAAVGSGGRSQRLRELADRDPVARRLTERGMVKSWTRDGAMNIVCPFEDDHASGAGAESSTQYFLPHTNGHDLGHFKCLHDTCLNVNRRTRGQFLSRLGLDETAGEGEDEEFEDLEGDGDGEQVDVGGGGSGSGSGGSGAAVGSRKAKVPKHKHLCTDLANANRIAKKFGKKLMMVSDSWYTWSGKVWERQDSDVWRNTATLSEIIHAEEAHYRALPAADDAQRAVNIAIADALKKWAAKCENTDRMGSAIKLLSKMLTVDAKALNAAEHLLNCQNGTVDLRTGELQPHNPDNLITQMAPFNYDPAAKCPTWNTVLPRIFMEDSLGMQGPLTRFIQRWFGYCATGSVREQKFLVHFGQGSNGKSTILDMAAMVLGDYAGTAAPGLLMASHGEKHPTEVADLFGRRMVTAHESNEGGSLGEDFIKRATGGDMMKARFMRMDFFEWQPTHKLQLLTNYKPQVRGQDHGIWRRILLVPYQARFGTQAEVNCGKAHFLKDVTLMAALKEEAEGILAWIVRGAIEWYQDGLQEPDIVQAASNEYQSEQDRLAQFTIENCLADREAETPMTGAFGVYEAYRDWCKDSGFNPLSKTRFKNELERVFPGLRFRETMPGNGRSGGATRRRVTMCIGLRLLDSE